ncbi:MAG: hypothetical protein ACE5GX_10075 [Thermoanaerobaculia bacterium]
MTFLRVAAVLFLFVSTGEVARAANGGRELPESFEYKWTLGGFKGVMARMFIPGRGEGRLTTDAGSGDLLVTELRISSREGKRDEYWLYGAEIDPLVRRTVRAWSAQRFRGESKRKERSADGVDALDLASSIYYLRQELPTRSQEAEIWSSGRLNPVIIQPLGRGLARLNGRPVATRSYAIRGVSKPGRPHWRGKMDLVLTDDEEAVPLEIVVVRKGMRVRLELVDG